jgi:hypothetical protein
MSLLFRAAVLGAIAYFITRSLSANTGAHKRYAAHDDATAPLNELHPGEDNVWPTSESRPAAANAGPGA